MEGPSLVSPLLDGQSQSLCSPQKGQTRVTIEVLSEPMLAKGETEKLPGTRRVSRESSFDSKLKHETSK